MTDFLDACYEAIKTQETSIFETVKGVSEEDVDLLKNRRLIILTGCGDSYAVAEYGKWAFLGIGLNAVALSPLAISQVQLGEDCVVIGVSASGRSVTTIDALKTARAANASTVILTDGPKGKATENAGRVWLTQSGVNDYNISPSSVTTTAMAYLLKLAVMHEESPESQISHDLHQLGQIGRKMLKWAERVGQEVSEIMVPDSPLYMISDGPNHVAAQVGMMKFNEYSVVQSFAAQREDFRHHHVLSINQGDSAILISDSPPGDDDQRYMQVLTDRLKMRASHLYTPKSLGLVSALGQVIPNSIALQMAALYNVVRYDSDKAGWKRPNVDVFRIY